MKGTFYLIQTGNHISLKWINSTKITDHSPGRDFCGFCGGGGNGLLEAWSRLFSSSSSRMRSSSSLFGVSRSRLFSSSSSRMRFSSSLTCAFDLSCSSLRRLSNSADFFFSISRRPSNSKICARWFSFSRDKICAIHTKINEGTQQCKNLAWYSQKYLISLLRRQLRRKECNKNQNNQK